MDSCLEISVKQAVYRPLGAAAGTFESGQEVERAFREKRRGLRVISEIYDDGCRYGGGKQYEKDCSMLPAIFPGDLHCSYMLRNGNAILYIELPSFISQSSTHIPLNAPNATRAQ